MQQNQQFKTDHNSGSINFASREPFPFDGKTRAKQAAQFLGIGLSTFWLFVKQQRIAPPLKLSARVSVWDCSYIRELAVNGIPEAPKTDT